MPVLRAKSSRWLLLASVSTAAACSVYSFTGGGGLPSHIDTIAILPFDNQTTQVTLTQELTQTLTDVVPSRLGLNFADEVSADAILRGSIRRYQNTATNYQENPTGPIIFQRRVTITISAEIYDTKLERAIWQSGSLSAVGEYLPDTQPEAEGRQLAIDNLAIAIIDGAQSQW